MDTKFIKIAVIFEFFINLNIIKIKEIYFRKKFYVIFRTYLKKYGFTEN